ncbi:conserved hypothetical protein [Ricinus communis]|uniref:Uncharacterized protein n=1 Tax=Ricinus communis TaxID=3988 RepID=B9SKS1_RICCO|nr:conserved hypothetical protein [Ricinus communis]
MESCWDLGREIKHLIQMDALKHFIAKKDKKKAREEKEPKERDTSGAKLGEGQVST